MNFNKRILWVPLSSVDFNSCSNFPPESNWREFLSITPIHRGFKMNLQLSLTLPLKMTSCFQSTHLNCPITKSFLYSLEESSYFSLLIVFYIYGFWITKLLKTVNFQVKAKHCNLIRFPCVTVCIRIFLLYIAKEKHNLKTGYFKRSD